MPRGAAMAAEHGQFHVSRRQFVQGVGVLGLAATGLLLSSCGSLPLQAQPASRVRRIGFLVAGSVEPNLSNVAAFEQGLHEQGYVPGHDVLIEYRYGEAQVERL